MSGHVSVACSHRFSTAGSGESPFLAVCFARLPTGRLLNLGAGKTGAFVGGSCVVNVDHVKPAEFGPGTFVVADGDALPFRSGSFAGIVAKDVLEHLPNPISALMEIHRAALDDAMLLITVPRAIARAVWDDPTHVRGFTQHALRTALRLSGWRHDVAIRRIGSIPGVGRLGLTTHLETFLRIPIFGHWFGTNWMVLTRPIVEELR